MLALPHRMLFETRLVVAYDVGSLALLAMAWTMMNFAPPSVIHADCFRQDAGRTVIFLIVLFAAFAGLSSILVMLGSLKGEGVTHAAKVRHIVVSVIAVLSSWFMVHTTFALHYARRYYQDKTSRPHAENGGGLDFPEKGEPDYWDFAYYSFVIGMTSQVSDVGTTSRTMRRLTLVHSVLSFFFNTAILALAINIVAGGL
ncbi:MAG: DUF1345 domain-containing protein [Verrucomicrobia bacterium]|nr:DUF1345 domain-containing protein [Verrucomicrobiota bacterium]